MSDEKKIPGPPPDDFSKTTPNVKVPESGGQYDWDKTNYNAPRPPASSGDWGKTVTNIRPIDTERPDYGKTAYPGASNVSEVDWGMTQANVRVPQEEQFGPAPSEYEQQQAYDKTTPYFRLPEAERQKYQNLPPTPAEKAEQEEREHHAKGGIPGWFWVAAGLMSMFFFAIVVLLAVYFFLLRDTSFEATVKGAPIGSSVLVDDVQWGVTSEGDTKLLNLKAGRRTIKVVHPSYVCEPREVVGGNGTTPEPIIARCQAKKVEPGEDCTNIRLGEEDKAERCYNAALDGLPDPFTPEDLVKALNILVINFASGSYEIPPVRLAALQKGAGYIKKLPPGVVLEVGGHTDSDGTAASNQTLSENRAKAVRERLIQFGVRPEVLQTRGYGATQPKAGNDTEQGKFYNRRIQYSVVKK